MFALQLISFLDNATSHPNYLRASAGCVAMYLALQAARDAPAAPADDEDGTNPEDSV